MLLTIFVNGSYQFVDVNGTPISGIAHTLQSSVTNVDGELLGSAELQALAGAWQFDESGLLEYVVTWTLELSDPGYVFPNGTNTTTLEFDFYDACQNATGFCTPTGPEFPFSFDVPIYVNPVLDDLTDTDALMGQTVSVSTDGLGTDEDNLITSYNWTETSGYGLVVTDASDEGAPVNETIQFTAPIEYDTAERITVVFNVYAEDETGLTSQLQDVEIEVIPIPGCMDENALNYNSDDPPTGPTYEPLSGEFACQYPEIDAKITITSENATIAEGDAENITVTLTNAAGDGEAAGIFVATTDYVLTVTNALFDNGSTTKTLSNAGASVTETITANLIDTDADQQTSTIQVNAIATIDPEDPLTEAGIAIEDYDISATQLEITVQDVPIYGCKDSYALNTDCSSDANAGSLVACSDGVTVSDGSCIYAPTADIVVGYLACIDDASGDEISYCHEVVAGVPTSNDCNAGETCTEVEVDLDGNNYPFPEDAQRIWFDFSSSTAYPAGASNPDDKTSDAEQGGLPIINWDSVVSAGWLFDNFIGDLGLDTELVNLLDTASYEDYSQYSLSLLNNPFDVAPGNAYFDFTVQILNNDGQTNSETIQIKISDEDVYGCMDQNANNYSDTYTKEALLTSNTTACTYTPVADFSVTHDAVEYEYDVGISEGVVFEGDTLSLNAADSAGWPADTDGYTGIYSEPSLIEYNWTITYYTDDIVPQQVGSQETYTNGTVDITIPNIPYGAGSVHIQLQVTNQNDNTNISSGQFNSVTVGTTIPIGDATVYGCMDDTAINYKNTATENLIGPTSGFCNDGSFACTTPGINSEECTDNGMCDPINPCVYWPAIIPTVTHPAAEEDFTSTSEFDINWPADYLALDFIYDTDPNLGYALEDVVHVQLDASTMSVSESSNSGASDEDLLNSIRTLGGVLYSSDEYNSFAIDANILFNPPANFVGTIEIDYNLISTVTDWDSAGISATGKFILSTSAVVDAPGFITSLSVTKDEEFAQFTVDTATDNITDPDNDPATLLYQLGDTTLTDGLLTIDSYDNATGILTISSITDVPTNAAFIDVVIPIEVYRHADPEDLQSEKLIGATANVTVRINNIDDAPIVINEIANLELLEDFGTQTIDLTNVFSDVDNTDADITKQIVYEGGETPSVVTDILSYSIVDNTLTLTSKANQSGTETITIRGTSNGVSVDDSFDVVIGPVNDAPVIDLSGVTINDVTEDDWTTISRDLSSYISDIETDVAGLTLSIVEYSDDLIQAGITGKTLIINPHVDAHKNGDVDITIKVDDGTCATNTDCVANEFSEEENCTDAQWLTSCSQYDTISFTIDAVNDPPIFDLSGGADVPATESLAVALGVDGGVDEEFSTITYPLSSLRNYVSQEYGETDTLSYQVDTSGTTTEYITVSIDSENLNIGSITNIPPTNNAVTATISLTIKETLTTDEFTVTDSFDFVINPVNDPPVFTNAPDLSATEDVQWYWDMTGSDPEGESIEFILQSGPTGMEIVGQRLQWTPPEGIIEYTEDFTVRVRETGDNNSYSDYSGTITVTPVEDDLIITLPSSAETIDESTDAANLTTLDLTGISIFDVDTDPTNLVFTVSSDNTDLIPNQTTNNSATAGVIITEGSVTDENSDGTNDTKTYSLTIRPAHQQYGPATLTITATPLEGAEVTADIDITVTEIPEAPVITGFIPIGGTQADFISIEDLVANGLTYEEGNMDEAFEIQFADADLNPLADYTNVEFQVAGSPNSAFGIRIDDMQLEGGLTGLPLNHLWITQTDENLTGSTGFQLSVTEAQLSTTTETIVVEFTAVDDPLITVDKTINIQEYTPTGGQGANQIITLSDAIINAYGEDATIDTFYVYNGEGSPQALVIDEPFEAPFGAQIILNSITGTTVELQYTPFQYSNADETFVFEVLGSDGLTSNTATITLSISPYDDPPTTTGFDIEVADGPDEGGDIYIKLTGFDQESTTLDFATAVAPSYGTLEYLDGANANCTDNEDDCKWTSGQNTFQYVKYTHNGTENFTDSFQYNVTDGTTVSAATTVNIAIQDINDNAPTITLTPATLNINEGATVNSIATVGDVDVNNLAQDLTISFDAGDGSAPVLNEDLYQVEVENTSNTTRTLRVTAAPQIQNDVTKTLTVNVSDGTFTTPATLTINLQKVNNAPNVPTTDLYETAGMYADDLGATIWSHDENTTNDATVHTIDFYISDPDPDDTPDVLTIFGGGGSIASAPYYVSGVGDGVPSGNNVYPLFDSLTITAPNSTSDTLRRLNYTLAANKNGSTTFKILVMDNEPAAQQSNQSNNFTIEVGAVNTPPSITPSGDSPIPAEGETYSTEVLEYTSEAVTVGPLQFTISDIESACADISLSATSNNATLIANNSITITDTGDDCVKNISMSPSQYQYGTATITIIATDEGEPVGTNPLSDTHTFNVDVTAVNVAPSFVSFPLHDDNGTSEAALELDEDFGTTALTPGFLIEVGDIETAAVDLTVSITPNPASDIVTATLQTTDLGDQYRYVQLTSATNNGFHSDSTTTQFDVSVTDTADAGSPALTTTKSFFVKVNPVDDHSNFVNGQGIINPEGIFAYPAGAFDITVPEDTDTTTWHPFNSGTPLYFVVNDIDSTPSDDGGSLDVYAGSIVDAADIVESVEITWDSSYAHGNDTHHKYNINITPQANAYGGPAVIPIVVQDTESDGSLVTKDLYFKVTAADDDVPVPTNYVRGENAFIVDEDISAGITIQATDLDAEELEFTINTSDLSMNGIASGSIQYGAVSLLPNMSTTIPAEYVTLDGIESSLELTFNPAPDFNGVARFNYSVYDGENTVPALAEISVGAVNDPPTLEQLADITSTESGASLNPIYITVRAEDVDISTNDDSIEFDVQVREAEAPYFTVESNGAVLISPSENLAVQEWIITPVAFYTGETQVFYTATDTHSDSDSKSFVLTIEGDNDAPVLEDISNATILENSTYSTNATITLTAHDYDIGTEIDDFVWEVTGDEITSGDIVFEWQDEASIQTQEDNGGANGITYVSGVGTYGSEVSPINYYTLTRTIKFQPGNSTYFNNFDSPDNNISISISDSEATTPKSFTLTVSNVIENPVITTIDDVSFDEIDSGAFEIPIEVVDYSDLGVEFSVAEETGVSLSFSDAILVDPEGSRPATYTNTLLVEPDNYDANESYDIDVTVTHNKGLDDDGNLSDAYDAARGSATESFTLTVAPVNDAPTLTAINDLTSASAMDEDTPVSFDLVAADVDGDDLYYTANSDDANISVSLDETTLTLTPATDYFTTSNATITVTVYDRDPNDSDQDAIRLSASRTFQVQVKPVHDQPEIAGLTTHLIPEDSIYEIPLSLSYVDAKVLQDDPDLTGLTYYIDTLTGFAKTQEELGIGFIKRCDHTLGIPYVIGGIGVECDDSTDCGGALGDLLCKHYLRYAPTEDGSPPLYNHTDYGNISFYANDGAGEETSESETEDITLYIYHVNDPPSWSTIAPIAVNEDADDIIIDLSGYVTNIETLGVTYSVVSVLDAAFANQTNVTVEVGNYDGSFTVDSTGHYLRISIPENWPGDFSVGAVTTGITLKVDNNGGLCYDENGDRTYTNDNNPGNCTAPDVYVKNLDCTDSAESAGGYDCTSEQDNVTCCDEQTFYFIVTPLNDAPVLTPINTVVNITEGATVVKTQRSMFGYSDVDTDQTITASIISGNEDKLLVSTTTTNVCNGDGTGIPIDTPCTTPEEQSNCGGGGMCETVNAFQFTAQGNEYGDVPVTVSITDDVISQAVQNTFTVTITELNDDNPELYAISDLNLNENDIYFVPLSDYTFDPDSMATFTYTVDVYLPDTEDDGTDRVSAEIGTGTHPYDDFNPDAAGNILKLSLLSNIVQEEPEVQVKITVTDDQTNSVNTMFSVYVAPVNDVPVISEGPSSFTMNENSEHSIAFSSYTITDPDQVENYTFTNVRAMTGDTNSAEVDTNINISSNNTHITIDQTADGFTDYFNSFWVWVDIQDDGGQTDGNNTITHKFQGQIINVNDAPVVSNIGDQTVAEDTAFFIIPISAADVDNEGPFGFYVESNDGNVSGTIGSIPAGDFVVGEAFGDPVSGTQFYFGDKLKINITSDYVTDGATITVKATDGELISESETFTVTVTSTDDAPQIYVEDDSPTFQGPGSYGMEPLLLVDNEANEEAGDSPLTRRIILKFTDIDTIYNSYDGGVTLTNDTTGSPVDIRVFSSNETVLPRGNITTPTYSVSSSDEHYYYFDITPVPDTYTSSLFIHIWIRDNNDDPEPSYDEMTNATWGDLMGYYKIQYKINAVNDKPRFDANTSGVELNEATDSPPYLLDENGTLDIQFGVTDIDTDDNTLTVTATAVDDGDAPYNAPNSTSILPASTIGDITNSDGDITIPLTHDNDLNGNVKLQIDLTDGEHTVTKYILLNVGATFDQFTYSIGNYTPVQVTANGTQSINLIDSSYFTNPDIVSVTDMSFTVLNDITSFISSYSITDGVLTFIATDSNINPGGTYNIQIGVTAAADAVIDDNTTPYSAETTFEVDILNDTPVCLAPSIEVEGNWYHFTTNQDTPLTGINLENLVTDYYNAYFAGSFYISSTVASGNSLTGGSHTSMTYTPQFAAGNYFTGEDSFTFNVVNDGYSGTVNGCEIKIFVQDTEDLPFGTYGSFSQTVDEGGNTTINLQGQDFDGDAIEIQMMTSGVAETAEVISANYETAQGNQIAPATNEDQIATVRTADAIFSHAGTNENTDYIYYRVVNTDSTTSPIYMIIVNPIAINDAPVLYFNPAVFTSDAEPQLTLTEDGHNSTPVYYNISATDEENDSVTFDVNPKTLGAFTIDIANQDAGARTAQLEINTLENQFTDEAGIDVTVTADDGQGGTDSRTLNIEVTPENDQPVISSLTAVQDVDEGSSLLVEFVITDPDLTFSSLPDGFSVTVTDGDDNLLTDNETITSVSDVTVDEYGQGTFTIQTNNLGEIAYAVGSYESYAVKIVANDGSGADNADSEAVFFELQIYWTDCNSNRNGAAYRDSCDDCVGGATSNEENYQDYGCGCDVEGPAEHWFDTDGDGLGTGDSVFYCKAFGSATDKTCAYENTPGTAGLTDCVVPAGWVENDDDDNPFCLPLTQGPVSELYWHPTQNYLEDADLTNFFGRDDCGNCHYNADGTVNDKFLAFNHGAHEPFPDAGNQVNDDITIYNGYTAKDCHGVCNGASFYDNCGICSCSQENQVLSSISNFLCNQFELDAPWLGTDLPVNISPPAGQLWFTNEIIETINDKVPHINEDWCHTNGYGPGTNDLAGGCHHVSGCTEWDECDTEWNASCADCKDPGSAFTAQWVYDPSTTTDLTGSPYEPCTYNNDDANYPLHNASMCAYQNFESQEYGTGAVDSCGCTGPTPNEIFTDGFGEECCETPVSCCVDNAVTGLCDNTYEDVPEEYSSSCYSCPSISLEDGNNWIEIVGQDIYGCMEPNAPEYNPDATIDNGIDECSCYGVECGDATIEYGCGGILGTTINSGYHPDIYGECQGGAAPDNDGYCAGGTGYEPCNFNPRANYDLPFLFPIYFEEFDFNNDSILNIQDTILWTSYGRHDITEYVNANNLGGDSTPDDDYWLSLGEPPDDYVMLTNEILISGIVSHTPVSAGGLCVIVGDTNYPCACDSTIQPLIYSQDQDQDGIINCYACADGFGDLTNSNGTNDAPFCSPQLYACPTEGSDLYHDGTYQTIDEIGDHYYLTEDCDNFTEADDCLTNYHDQCGICDGTGQTCVGCIDASGVCYDDNGDVSFTSTHPCTPSTDCPDDCTGTFVYKYSNYEDTKTHACCIVCDGGDDNQCCIENTGLDDLGLYCNDCTLADYGSNCYDGWVTEAACEGNCNEGVCDAGAYEDFMRKTDCEGLCDGGFCMTQGDGSYYEASVSASDVYDIVTSEVMLKSDCEGLCDGGLCLKDGDSYYNGTLTDSDDEGTYPDIIDGANDFMFKSDCGAGDYGQWCVNGTCWDCPPVSASFINQCGNFDNDSTVDDYVYQPSCTDLYGASTYSGERNCYNNQAQLDDYCTGTWDNIIDYVYMEYDDENQSNYPQISIAGGLSSNPLSRNTISYPMEDKFFNFNEQGCDFFSILENSFSSDFTDGDKVLIWMNNNSWVGSRGLTAWSSLLPSPTFADLSNFKGFSIYIQVENSGYIQWTLPEGCDT